MISTLKKHFIFVFILGLITGIGISIGLSFLIVDNPIEMAEFLKNYYIVKKYYYHDISDQKLFEGASIGLLEILNDPHSKFLTKEEYSSLVQQTTGEYTGVGIILGKNKEQKTIVMGVLDQSSAKEKGILFGDVITKVDNKEIDNEDLANVVSKIRGEKGTKVIVTIKRDNIEKDFELTRIDLSLPTVKSYMVTNDIGYIHIFSFATKTSEEVKNSLLELKNKGAKKFIIDLRMNPGGIIDSVVDVANQFLKKGTIVSYYPKNDKEKVYKIKGLENNYPLVVLIDRYSASASEIFAGAVQDKKEGIVLGEKSFGKGTVQSIISNGDGTAIKISIAEYKTANGRNIDKIGIIPDEKVEQTGMVFDIKTDSVFKRAIEILDN